jgi:hypothetical protein
MSTRNTWTYLETPDSALYVSICLCFENIQKLGFNVIPWKEGDIRSLLNTLRDQEITPHKLQGIWNTLRWFSAKFGLLDPDSLERPKAKRKTIQEGLVETNIISLNAKPSSPRRRSS